MEQDNVYRRRNYVYHNIFVYILHPLENLYINESGVINRQNPNQDIWSKSNYLMMVKY